MIKDTRELKAPFPYFGGKRKAAHLVWPRLGDVKNYVEPFAGSLAVLLARPEKHKGTIETVNDLDGFIANFWRALAADPDAVAQYADWPVNENDLHARHVWLVQQAETLRSRLEGNPEYYDAKIAGWWVWGMACWIGGAFCSGNGPWHSVETEEGRQLANVKGNTGQGVQRRRVCLGSGRGVNRKRVHLGTWKHAADVTSNDNLLAYMHQLADRLRTVRVASGDWSRVCGPAVTYTHGLTGVFLDPPYADDAQRANDLYRKDNLTVAHEVREWAIANGDNPLMRIALCGLEHEHGPHMPPEWEMVAWNAGTGYGGKRKDGTINDNGKAERIWFSPHCLKSYQALPIFAAVSK